MYTFRARFIIYQFQINGNFLETNEIRIQFETESAYNYSNSACRVSVLMITIHKFWCTFMNTRQRSNLSLLKLRSLLHARGQFPISATNCHSH